MPEKITPKLVPCNVTPVIKGTWSVIDGVLADDRILFTVKAIPMPFSEARLQFKTGPDVSFHVLEKSNRLGENEWTLNWYSISIGKL